MANTNVPDAMLIAGELYAFAKDARGSVRQVIDLANGTVVQALTYDEFGRVLEDTNPGFQPFGFAGGLYDADTQLVRFGARDYDAEVGRWTSKDPIRWAGGQGNLYVYVGNDPVGFTDPEGTSPHLWAAAGIGATVNTVGYFATTSGSDVSARGITGAVFGGALTGVSTALNPFGGAALGGALGTGLEGLIAGAHVTLEGLTIGALANLTGSALGAGAVARAGLFPTSGLLVKQGVKEVGEDLLARATAASLGGELLLNIFGRGLTNACD